MKYYILGKSNNDIIQVSSLDRYADWEVKNQERRIISRNRMWIDNEEIYISTVFLGLDHSHNDLHAPIVFETMIFGGKNDGWQDRYSTYREAIEGHNRAFLKVMNNEELTYS